MRYSYGDSGGPVLYQHDLLKRKKIEQLSTKTKQTNMDKETEHLMKANYKVITACEGGSHLTAFTLMLFFRKDEHVDEMLSVKTKARHQYTQCLLSNIAVSSFVRVLLSTSQVYIILKGFLSTKIAPQISD